MVMKSYDNKKDMYNNCGYNKFFVNTITNNQMCMKYQSFKDYETYISYIQTEYNNKPMRFCEMISENNKCKPYLDIEYILDDDVSEKDIKINKKEYLDKLTNEIINVFKEHYKYDLDKKYIYIADSSGKCDEGYKISFHIIITTPDQVLFETNIKTRDNSAYHLAKELSKTGKFNKSIDLRVYFKDSCMRTLKSYKDLNNTRQFKKYLCTSHTEKFYITNFDESKPFRILENKAPEELKTKIVKHINTEVIETIIDSNIIENDEIGKIIKNIVHGNISKIKIMEDNSKIYYYNNYCINCKKMHISTDNKSNIKSNITIRRDIHNVIELVSRCWSSNVVIKEFKMFIRRANDRNIQFNMDLSNIGIPDEHIKKVSDDYYNYLHSLIPLMKYNEPYEIITNEPKIINNAHILTNAEWLKVDDIYYKDKDTTFTVANEEFNKTGSHVNYISGIVNKDPKYKNDHGKKIIILAVNIATLASIRQTIDEENKQLEEKGMIQIKYMYYSGKDITLFEKDDNHVLITTLNKLEKLIMDDLKISNPSQYILWNDETNSTVQYIQSKTLKPRFRCIMALKQLVMFSHKCFFTCADMTNKIINLINNLRNGDCKIIHNKMTKKHRIYNGSDDINIFKNKLDESFDNNERLVLICDSKRKSDYYYYTYCKKFIVYKYNDLLKRTIELNKNGDFDENIKSIEIMKKIAENINDKFNKVFEEYYKCKNTYKLINKQFDKHIYDLQSDKVKKIIDTLIKVENDNRTNDELIKEFYKFAKKEFNENKKKEIDHYIKIKTEYESYMTFYKNNCEEIYLINSDNNNDSQSLKILNETIKNKDIKMLICSPSLGIGINLKVCQKDKTYHFDRLFCHVMGKSTSAQATQQMLNRVRNFQYNEHHIFFDNINVREHITEEKILSNIMINIEKNYDPIIKELRLTVDPYDNDFRRELYIRSVIDRNLSMNDFKYNLIKEINNRGHKFIYHYKYIPNLKMEHLNEKIINNIQSNKNINNEEKKTQLKEYKTQIKQINDERKTNNEVYNSYSKEKSENLSKIDMILELIELNNVEEICNSKTITENEFSKNITEQKKGMLLTKDQKNSVTKFKIYEKYNINKDASIHDVVKFVLEDSNKLELHNKLKLLKKYVINDWDDKKLLELELSEKQKSGEILKMNKLIETKENVLNEISKHKCINKLIIDMGFNNGIKDNSILDKIIINKPSQEEINKMSFLFGREIKKIDFDNYNEKYYVNFVSGLLEKHYGLTLECQRKKEKCCNKEKGKPAKNIYTNFKINVPDILKDYIIIKYRNKGAKALNIKLDDKFNLTKIHNFKGTYKSYMDEWIINKLKFEMNIKLDWLKECAKGDCDNYDHASKIIIDKYDKLIQEVYETGKYIIRESDFQNFCFQD